MPRHGRNDLIFGLFAALGLICWGCAKSTAPGASSSEAANAEQASEYAPAATSDVESVPESTAGDEPIADLARAENIKPPALDVPTEPPTDSEASTKKPAPSHAAAEPPAPLPAAKAPLPYDGVETAELAIPEVVLSEQHASLCKVRVADPFPNLELPNLDGEKRSLTELFGAKLTLVVFWNATQTTGLEELSDLSRYYLPRFGDKGLAVVAINTGDQPQLAHELANHVGTGYPVLCDSDGEALKQVATGKLPRTYLLDASGKVLWFDLEYSPTTRRDLAAAIRVSLGQ